jgi:DNA-3-methyladenine glycosylase II
LRPVLFYSLYEAAALALIGHRIRIAQAAKVKAQMAKELGPSVEIGGEPEHAFLGPSSLMRLESFPGLFRSKVEKLRRLCQEAMKGKLDAAYLRSLSVGEALLVVAAEEIALEEVVNLEAVTVAVTAVTVVSAQ